MFNLCLIPSEKMKNSQNAKTPESYAIRGFSVGSGRWIRTNDLWVMSPTSYPCSIPHYILLIKSALNLECKYTICLGVKQTIY